MSYKFDFDSLCLSRVRYRNMFVPLCIVWKKNEQWSVLHRLKVYQVPRHIDGCQCTTGIVLFCSGVSTSGMFKNGCTNVKLEEGAGRLSKSITDETLNESVTWSYRTDEWVLMKWYINRKLVTEQPVKLSTTKLPFIKSYHDRFRSDSQNHTNRNVLTSAKVFWSLW